MKKIYTASALIIIVALIGLGIWLVQSKQSIHTISDPRNASYIIEGNLVTLADGVSVTDVSPHLGPQTTTKYFGNDAKGDLNGDGLPDTAFILTQETSGSGTFYYVAVALDSKQGYQGTNALFLGDRIAPQTTEIKDGEITVNYADRKAGEPMTAKPTVGVSKYFDLVGTELRPVIKK